MAWAFVQAKSTSTSNYTAALSVTMTSTPTTGNIVIGVASSPAGSSSQTLAIKDGNSNSLAAVGSAVVNSTNVTVEMFVYTVPATPSATFSFTTSVTGGSPSFQVMEFSGATTTTDGSSGTATGSTSPAAATYSDTATNELLVTFFGDWGASITATVPSGYTAASANINTSAAADNMVGYKNSTGGSETGTASWSYSPTTGDQWGVITVAFKLPAGAGLVPVIPKMPYVQAVRRAALY